MAYLKIFREIFTWRFFLEAGHEDINKNVWMIEVNPDDMCLSFVTIFG